jgi:single-strand DNA-binding protein
VASDINRVVIVGRLTRDSELSYTNTGFALTKIGIAVNRRKKQGDDWIDEASFYDLIGWGKRYESLNQYLNRGQQVAIEGHLKQERWEKDGQKRSKVVIEMDDIQLLGGKNNNQSVNSDYSPKNDPRHNGQQNNGNSFNNGGGFEDDIPF